jgi:hypothetical protein
MPWSTPFDEPIALRGGRTLATLQQAADYIMKLRGERCWVPASIPRLP